MSDRKLNRASDEENSASGIRHSNSSIGVYNSSEGVDNSSDCIHSSSEGVNNSNEGKYNSSDAGPSSSNTGHNFSNDRRISSENGHTPYEGGHSSSDVGRSPSDVGHSSSDERHSSSDVGHSSSDVGHSSSVGNNRSIGPWGRPEPCTKLCRYVKDILRKVCGSVNGVAHDLFCSHYSLEQMSFGIIRDKAEQHFYKSIEEFESDMRKTFSRFYQYYAWLPLRNYCSRMVFPPTFPFAVEEARRIQCIFENAIRHKLSAEEANESISEYCHNYLLRVVFWSYSENGGKEFEWISYYEASED